MKDRAARVIATCRQIAQMSEETGRTTRRFLTQPMHDVHALLRARMEALGMSVQIDAAGSLRGLSQSANNPHLILGSHIDSVPDAGAFDGVLGVIMAIEWVELAQALSLPLSMEVIAFSEEEGVRFGVPFLGSRTVAGSFDPALLALRDSDGTTVEQAIRNFGLDPQYFAEAAIETPTLGFVEIHIEQGPVLEAENLQLAAVTAIAGQTRMSLEFHGQANHAGTTPMQLRRDALVAAAEWITAVEAIAVRTEGMVATVGKIHVEPNAGNIVPGLSRVSLDLRHAQDSTRHAAIKELLDKAAAIASRRHLQFDATQQMDQPAVPMDKHLTDLLAEAIEAQGMPPRRLHSGAGHDAMIMAARMPSAMLFLRSPAGISHHPSETVREEDVEAALLVGQAFLTRLAAVLRR